jgi:hypothetical protein
VGQWKSDGFFNWNNFEHYGSPSKPRMMYGQFFHGASSLSS